MSSRIENLTVAGVGRMLVVVVAPAPHALRFSNDGGIEELPLSGSARSASNTILLGKILRLPCQRCGMPDHSRREQRGGEGGEGRLHHRVLAT